MKTISFFTLLLASLSLFAEPTNRIFVTNEKGDSITVINAETLEVETTLEDIGERPRGIGLSPDGSELYVAASEDNGITVIDPKTLKKLRFFESGSDPETFAVHPNGNLYISNEDEGLASAFDPKTGNLITEIEVGLEPEGVAVSPNGKDVIVTSEADSILHVISVPEHKIRANIVVGARPRAATFSADSKFAYSTSEISGEVKKVDMETAKIIKVGALGNDKAKPKDILLSKDEKSVYVAGGRANSVYVLDAETLEVQKAIPVGKRVWGLAMNSDKSRLFTTDGPSSTVSVIDTATNENIKTIEVGSFPWGIVVDD